MMKVIPFKDVNVDEEFVYLAKTYRKIVKPNGKVGAIDIVSKLIFPDCNHWTTCYVSRSDTVSEITQTNPNRTNFSIVGNDGELYNIISLTSSQARLLDWLDDNGYLSDDINIEKAPSIKVIEV